MCDDVSFFFASRKSQTGVRLKGKPLGACTSVWFVSLARHAHPQREDVETKIFMAMGLCTLKAKLTLKKSSRMAGKKTTQSALITVWRQFGKLLLMLCVLVRLLTSGAHSQDCACELELHVSSSGFSLEGGMSEKGCTSADLAGRSCKWTFENYNPSWSFSRSHSTAWTQEALFRNINRKGDLMKVPKSPIREQQVQSSSSLNFGSQSYLLIPPA